ncbi:hypothetical protein RchiOBHm_Chr3g0450181 [Rosa chinensis]|uniref:Uncharacterized protein n=1 Tax=Rosa chinensis TaxID=74649 RepID=A0A2P6R5Q7_ROSCH|nr:hypothetical protein RchiOBHm_Chr3g0450181 [Rosa chinensis]
MPLFPILTAPKSPPLYVEKSSFRGLAWKEAPLSTTHVVSSFERLKHAFSHSEINSSHSRNSDNTMISPSEEIAAVSVSSSFTSFFFSLLNFLHSLL